MNYKSLSNTGISLSLRGVTRKDSLFVKGVL